MRSRVHGRKQDIDRSVHGKDRVEHSNRSQRLKFDFCTTMSIVWRISGDVEQFVAYSSAELYDLILSAVNYLQGDGGQFRRGQEKANLSHDEFWLLNRFRYFPGTVAPSDFLTFGPYTSVSIYAQALETLVAKKLAEKVDGNRYRLTDVSRKVVENLYRDYFNAIAKHDALPDDVVRRLGALADRAVAAAVRQPEVPAPITNAARSTFPNTDQPWVYAERRVVAMAVFHDDAYIAAWREDGWSGPRIAVSTALFKAKERLSYDDLREAAARLDDQDFKSALAALHSGGDVSYVADNFYQLTSAGRAARQSIEAATERNYLLMFNVLEGAELKELTMSLERLRG